MPVNWTSGKRKLAQKHIRHKRGATSFKGRRKATWNVGAELPVQGGNVSSGGRRSQPKIFGRNKSIHHTREDKTLSSNALNFLEFRTETSTVSPKKEERNLVKKATETNHDCTTGTDKKRRALLATTDWVGLFHKAGISSSARGEGASTMTGYKSAAGSSVCSQTGTELAPVDWGKNAELDAIDRSPCSESASSSSALFFGTAALVSPGSESLDAMIDELASASASSSPRSSSETSRTHRSQPLSERPIEMSHSTAGTSVSSPSPIVEFPPGNPNTTPITESDARVSMPTWISLVSHALGFSPPTRMSEFEHQRALEAEQRHTASISQGQSKSFNSNAGPDIPSNPGSEPNPLGAADSEFDFEFVQHDENIEAPISQSLHVYEPHDVHVASEERELGQEKLSQVQDGKDASEIASSRLSLWRKLDVGGVDQLRLRFDDDQLFGA